MATHGISNEEVERSVRLLTLCSLGAQQSVLPYGVIATALKVSYTECYAVWGAVLVWMVYLLLAFLSCNFVMKLCRVASSESINGVL